MKEEGYKKEKEREREGRRSVHEEKKAVNEGHERVERNEIPGRPVYRGINPVQPGHY